MEEQQGRWGGDIGEAAHVVQEGGAGEEEALVPILNLLPVDSLSASFLAGWKTTKNGQTFWIPSN